MPIDFSLVLSVFLVLAIFRFFSFEHLIVRNATFFTYTTILYLLALFFNKSESYIEGFLDLMYKYTALSLNTTTLYILIVLIALIRKKEENQFEKD